MASSWTLLKTDYADRSWSGDKQYEIEEQSDGNYTITDVTEYTNEEDSFFGADDANSMNTALNYIMSALEDGTDLYQTFVEYFDTQKSKFTSEVDDILEELEETFTTWFESMKDQLTDDAAGALQTEVDEITTSLGGLSFAINEDDYGLDITVTY